MRPGLDADMGPLLGPPFVVLAALHELDEHVPKHRLTDWFSDRVQRLYNVFNVK